MIDPLDQGPPDEALTEEQITECKDWLATRRACLDQRKKMWEDQYPLRCPQDNQERLHDLEVWAFRIEMNEFELKTLIAMKEEIEESDD